MTKFLGLIRLSAPEAARTLRDGPGARPRLHRVDRPRRRRNVEHLWLTNVGDWDLVCVVDMADETAAAGAAATWRDEPLD